MHFDSMLRMGTLHWASPYLCCKGKTNHEGKENFGVVVWNKDVEICPVNSLAFYLFEQWMVRKRETRGFGIDCMLVRKQMY